jgi:hypothetical protein
MQDFFKLVEPEENLCASESPWLKQLPSASWRLGESNINRKGFRC